MSTGPGSGATAPAPERVELAPGYSICRIVQGGWQLSAGHRRGGFDRTAALDRLLAAAEAGFTTFDSADIYTGVEELVGEVARRRREQGAPAIEIHTKLVPDLEALPTLDRRYVERVVDRSLARLGVERIDLVQLHWWDYSVPGWLDAAGWLDELRRAGKVRLLGLTNFDVPRLVELVAAGLPVAALQTQYSLLDRRPERGAAELCRRHGIALLAYGSLAGGFLTDRWLGRPAPPASDEALADRSLIKYRLIVDELSGEGGPIEGWPALQEVLAAAARIARRHGVTLASVAQRWVLDRPGVAGVLVGASARDRRAENLATFGLRLGKRDRELLAEVLARHPGPPGDLYDLERIPGGRHAAIMRTGLNRVEQ